MIYYFNSAIQSIQSIDKQFGSKLSKGKNFPKKDDVICNIKSSIGTLRRECIKDIELVYGLDGLKNFTLKEIQGGYMITHVNSGIFFTVPK